MARNQFGLYNPDMPRQNITSTEYAQLQRAFSFFNERLFGGELPDALITLQRQPHMKGYFWSQQFAARIGHDRTDEIALNPECFDRSDAEVLSTLVHEMVHLWQDKNGKPSRRGYHNQEWAEKMKAIGLQPTATGEPGGAETGEKMTHCIVVAGPFDQACAAYLAGASAITWRAIVAGEEQGKKKAKPTRQKFTCPGCGLNAWAKPEARLLCAECSEEQNDLVELEAGE